MTISLESGWACGNGFILSCLSYLVENTLKKEGWKFAS